VHPTIKTKDGKKLKVKALIDLGCTNTTITRKTVEEKGISTKSLPRPFDVYNSDGSRNGEKTIKEFVPLEINLNGHIEQIDAIVSEIKETDLFLEHDWLVEHNPEVDWKEGVIWFTRCPEHCKTEHESIWFTSWSRRLLPKEEEESKGGNKEPNPTNPEDLPKYVQLFTHLFNKKKFKKLPDKQEWDHEINLMEEAPKELNAKSYPMTLKEEETLNQWLDEQLKAGLIVESNSRYAAPCFFIPKKDGTLRLVQDYRWLNQHTIKDKTPLPLINEVINKLKDAKYFNKLDLIWGYNNVWIKEGDK